MKSRSVRLIPEVLCILKTGPKDAEIAGGSAAMMVINDTHKKIQKPAN